MAKQSASKKWPRHIMILGVKVGIKYTSKVLYDGDDELLGCYVAETMTIHIRRHPDMKSTLCHEIFHAFLAISGYGQTMTVKAEEGLTCAFENAMRDYFTFV